MLSCTIILGNGRILEFNWHIGERFPIQQLTRTNHVTSLHVDGDELNLLRSLAPPSMLVLQVATHSFGSTSQQHSFLLVERLLDYLTTFDPEVPRTAQVDPVLIDWLLNVQAYAGDFLKFLAGAGMRADEHNYPVLRPVLLKMKEKYPEYDRPHSPLGLERP